MGRLSFFPVIAGLFLPQASHALRMSCYQDLDHGTKSADGSTLIIKIVENHEAMSKLNHLCQVFEDDAIWGGATKVNTVGCRVKINDDRTASLNAPKTIAGLIELSHPHQDKDPDGRTAWSYHGHFIFDIPAYGGTKTRIQTAEMLFDCYYGNALM